MVNLWQMVSVTFLGLFAMGNIDTLASSSKNIGAYGTTTGTVAELFFFLTIATLVFVFLKAYFES